MTQITFYNFLFFYPLFLLIISCSINKQSVVLDKDYIKSFYEDGKIEYKSEVVNGILHGKTIYWFENGEIKSESFYNNGILHNYYKEYFSNGSLKYTIEYNLGNKDGFERWYYDNGQIKSEKKYKNNKIINKIVRWDKNGNIIY